MWDLIISVPDHCLSFYFVTDAFDILNNYPVGSVLYVTL